MISQTVHELPRWQSNTSRLSFSWFNGTYQLVLSLYWCCFIYTNRYT